MIATCPACGKRYRIADDAVPAAGRHVRCAACGTGWLVAPDGGTPAAIVPESTATVADPAALVTGPAADAAPNSREFVALTPVVAPAAAVSADPTRQPWSPDDDAPKSRRWGWWLAGLVAAVAVAALAVIEFAPADTFDPPRLGLPAVDLAAAPPLDLTRLPLVGDALDRLATRATTPASPLRIVAHGERSILANGTLVLTVTGRVRNPTDAPAALAAIDAALLDTGGHPAFRWRIAAPASAIGAHQDAAFESVAANYPAGATVLRLTPH